VNKAVAPLILCAVMLVTVAVIAEAQQPKTIPRIGYLSTGTGPADSKEGRAEAFRRGLRELGYIEGKSIIVEYRFVEGKPDRIPELVADLVRLKVDIIVTQTSLAARAAKRITTTIPIVMTNAGNPFGDGLIASLARPGGNVTGLTNVATDLGVKRLELLKEILPGLTRVAVLPSPGGAATERRELKEIEDAAPALKIQLHIMEVRASDDLEKAFEMATKAGARALVVTAEPTGLFAANRKKIVQLAAKKRLPAIYPHSRYLSVGAMMFYAANDLEMSRRGATYVDKILKGAKPADLPVEQPTKFEFVINLKAAKQIGLTIPPNVLARADRVIK
jgi:ABC-type uncharacterized transport system substrate-binding protein